jgi:WD40 repeat protein
MDISGQFAVSVRNSDLIVWDSQSGRQRFRLVGHAQPINGCAISADGTIVISAGSDKTVKLWDVGSAKGSRGFRPMKETRTFMGHQDGHLQPVQRFKQFQPHGRPAFRGYVRRCAISKSNSFVVSAAEDRTLILWDTQTGSLRLTLKGHSLGVSDCAISPDENFIVSSSDDKTLKIWNSSTGKELNTLEGHLEAVTACAISSDASVIVSASADKTIKVWDTTNGREQLTIQNAHDDVVTDCVIDSSSTMILSCSTDGSLKIWELSTGKKITSVRVAGGLRACAWVSSGSPIVAAGAYGLYFFLLKT